VTQFIIDNNTEHEYVHFELGRKDGERGGLFRIKAILVALVAWVRLLRMYPHAIIHYNFSLEKPSILRDPMFMQIAQWMKRKMVVHIHGGVFLTATSIPSPFIQILQHVFSWNYPFIALSDSEVKTLKERFGTKTVVSLPNCIDLRDAEKFIRPEKDIFEPLVLGYLGRIAETKGMDYLLAACITLKQKNIPFILKIAGSEEVNNKYLPPFRQALGEQFEYCGLVSGQLKNDFLRSLDVFVMPTFFEGLPVSLLECMSYGAVPVVTPVGSIPTVVEDWVNGLFIKEKDSESIVHSIIHLNSDRNLLLKLAQDSRKTIFDKFDPQNYVNKLNQLYEV